MPIPVPIPGGALPINDAVTAKAEALLAAFIQGIAAGTTGASLNTPAVTVPVDNSSSTTPELIDTAQKQLFFRHMYIAMAQVLTSAVNGESVGTTSNPTTASGSFSVIPEMTLTLATTGKPALVIFSGSFNVNASDSFDISIFVDGVEHQNARRHVECATAVAGQPASTQALITGLAGGSHTIDVRWRAIAGSARALGVLRSLSITELS